MSPELRKILEDLVEFALEAEKTVDGEWGMCRSIEELREAGELDPRILAAEKALADSAEEVL